MLYEKLLVFYELDLGLNHVVRKWSDAVDPTANKLITVPGGSDGPGGVIVCSENFLVYKSPAQAERRCALPRRKDLPNDHGLLITAAAVHRPVFSAASSVQSCSGKTSALGVAAWRSCETAARGSWSFQ